MSRSGSEPVESARSTPLSESSADPSHLQTNVNGGHENGNTGDFISFGGDDTEESMSESSESEEGIASETKSSTPPPDHPVDVLKLPDYFPTFDSNGQELGSSFEDRCMVCTGTGHASGDCPELTCESCGARNEHFTHACPSKKRCPRCRKTGHGLGTCSEFAVKPGDAVCDLCGQKGHIENLCALLWRTSSQVTPVKVDSLIVSCYFCGARAHYGADCPIRKARKRNVPVKSGLGGDSSFSIANASRFVIDPTTAFKVTGGKKSKLPERARSPDDAFFGKRVPPKKPRGKMSMTNLARKQERARLEQQGSSYRPPESSQRRNSPPRAPPAFQQRPQSSSAAPSLRDLFPNEVSSRPNHPPTLGGHTVQSRETDRYIPNQRSGRPRSRSPPRKESRNNFRQRSPPRGPAAGSRGGGGRGRGRNRRR